MRTEEVLEQLRGAGTEYVSGQQLCERFQVSRTAVWKAIRKLKDEGYEIEAVTNKGYRLVSDTADVLSSQEIERYLTTKWAGRPVLYRSVTGSSNDDIQALSDQGARQGTLVVTSQQTAGKGRRGRVWISPPDCNIYMSILLRPLVRADLAPMCTLVMALAICIALRELYPDADIGIKWPNDLVISVSGEPYRKFVGILTEMRLEETDIRDVVIGIGINANQDVFDPGIAMTATSLRNALGEPVGRARITAAVWNHFEGLYETFEEAASFAPLKALYEQMLVNRGRRVHVLDLREPFEGTAEGITERGELVVQRDDGSKVSVSSGEISVRGVEGYV